MSIQLYRTPVRTDAEVEVEVSGENLTLNGQVYDLSAVDETPTELDSPFICGPVFRLGGVVQVLVLQPYAEGEEPPPAGAMPQPPVPVPPAPSNPQIIAIAALQVNVGEGLITGIETAVGLSLAFAIDTGVYWVFFTEPQPDMNYIWNVGSSSGTLNVASRDLTMMELRAYEGGAPADPTEISIQVFRVT